MAARKKRPSRGRGFNFGGGYGAGFIWPVFDLTIDQQTLTIYSDQGTDIGTFSPTPANGVVTLIDSDGKKFQINNDGLTLEAGFVATGIIDQPTQPINVTVSWSGKSVAFPFTITLRDPSTLLSGSHSLAHTAAANTLVGNLTSDPSTGITYTIVSQDVVSGLKIVTAALEVSTGTLSAGPYNITIRATKGSNHWDTAFVLTLT